MVEQVCYEFVLLVDDLYMCNADERGKCKDVFNDDHKVTGKYSSGADGIHKLFCYLNFFLS